MLASNIPIKIPLIWASSAGASYITYPVPTPSQQGVTNGAASFFDGFPPNCFIPIASGGAGPFGRDFNGLLQQLTADVQWQQATGIWQYDGTFQSTIGGYPNGALVQSAVTQGLLWISTVDSNTTNPDTGGSGWSPLYLGGFGYANMAFYTYIGGVQQVSINGAAFTTTGATSFSPPPSGRCRARGWGGGGGGGGSNSSTGAGWGGGGGGYFEGTYSGLTTAQTITCGKGGSAGSSTGPTAGSTGGTTSFGSLATATGGGGGATSSGGSLAAGGTASGGYLNITGMSAGSFWTYPGGIATSAGGGGAFCTSASQATGDATGNPGIFPGGGASGGSAVNNGGLGANGCLLIEY